PIHVAIAPLKFSLQLYFELGEINEVPAREFPCAIFLPRLMFESDDQMHGLVAHLIRSHFGFEIECAKTAVTAAGDIKLWIEIEYSFARHIDNAQVGIAGTLHAAFRRAREIAIQSWRGVQ